jgi:hypothetical protein
VPCFLSLSLSSPGSHMTASHTALDTRVSRIVIAGPAYQSPPPRPTHLSLSLLPWTHLSASLDSSLTIIRPQPLAFFFHLLAPSWLIWRHDRHVAPCFGALSPPPPPLGQDGPAVQVDQSPPRFFCSNTLHSNSTVHANASPCWPPPGARAPPELPPEQLVSRAPSPSSAPPCPSSIPSIFE